MKGKISVIFLAVVMVACLMPNLTVSAATRSETTESKTSDFVPNEVLVMYEDGTVDTATQDKREEAAAQNVAIGKGFAQALKGAGVVTAGKARNTLGQQALILDQSLKTDYTIDNTIVFGEKSGEESVVSVVKSDELSTQQLMTKLKKNPGVKYVQPNYKRTAQAITANDERYNAAWHLNGEQGIHAESAWEQYAKQQAASDEDPDEVVVAVLDTGVDYKHEDLFQRMWHNPNSKLNGDVGYDFGDNDEDPMDEIGHGTHCAGIIAAQMNNEKGISGVTGPIDHVKIMALRVFRGEYAYDEDIFEALRYLEKAKSLGINVVACNLSLGGGPTSDLEAELFDRLGESGILALVAAGNSSENNDEHVIGPTDAASDYIVSVAATDADGELAAYSNYGKNSVDVAAPGSIILSTVPTATYAPYTYSNDTLRKTTQIYGEFDASSDTADGIKPVAGKDIKGEDVDSSLAGFGVAKTASQLTDGSEGTSEISLETGGKATLDAAGNDTSLRWDIKGAKEGDKYVIYFPYDQGNRQQKANGMISYRVLSEANQLIGVAAGDVVVGEENGDSQHARIEMIDSGSLPSGEWNRLYNSHWRSSELSGYLFDEENKGYRDTDSIRYEDGLGLVVTAMSDGDIRLKINSLAIAKSGTSESYGHYNIMSGTSMATPVVTGVVGVLAALNPDADAMQRKSLLLGLVRPVDSLKNQVSSGGIIDFNNYDPQALKKMPVLNDYRVDKDAGTVRIEGAGFGSGKPTIKAVFDLRNEECEIDPADISVDGNTLTIQDHYGLIGSYVTLEVTNDSELTGQRCYYLVKGLKRYTREATLTYAETEATYQWSSGKDKMYGNDTEGNLYQTSGTSIDQVGPDLETAVIEFANKTGESSDPNKRLWKLEFTEGVTLHPIGPPAYMNGNIYELVAATLGAGDRSSLMLVGMNVDAEDPQWTVYGDSLSDFGTIPGLENYQALTEFSSATLAAYNGKLYMLGRYDKDTFQAVGTVYSAIPDASGTSWTVEPESMASPRFGGKTILHDGKLYLLLGNSSAVSLNYDVDVFDGSKWTTVGTLPRALNETDYQGSGSQGIKTLNCVVGDDRRGILIAGASFDGVGDTFLFDPETGKSGNLGYNYFTATSQTYVEGGTAGGKLLVRTLSNVLLESYIDSIPVEVDPHVAADPVIDAIHQLPSADALKLSDKATVAAVRAAYDALNEEEKSLVSADLGKLEAAEKQITALQAAADKEAADKAAQSAFQKKKNKLTKVKALQKRSIKVSWKKVSGVGGYKVQYSLKKNFKTKTKSIKKSKTAVKISKLKAKKYYYVRVRAYKKIAGKTVYSKWSNVKKVKVRK